MVPGSLPTAAEQRRRGQQAQLGSGQLQGQRNAVKPAAQLGYRGGVLRGHGEVRAHLPGAGDQQPHGGRPPDRLGIGLGAG